jgi:hypothetical protein
VSWVGAGGRDCCAGVGEVELPEESVGGCFACDVGGVYGKRGCGCGGRGSDGRVDRRMSRRFAAFFFLWLVM